VNLNAETSIFPPYGVAMAPSSIPWPQGIPWSVKGRTQNHNGDFIVTSFPDGGNHVQQSLLGAFNAGQILRLQIHDDMYVCVCVCVDNCDMTHANA